MIQIQEEQINYSDNSHVIILTSYSDNSHLFGVPFVIKEELHATISCKRGDLRKMVEMTIKYPIEFHIAFEKLINPNDSEVRQ